VQLTVRSGGPAGSTVRVPGAPPPVGFDEVKINPPLPTSTQKVSLVQEMPESALAFGIFAGTQELGPSAGLVVVQTPPLKSTATQSEESGRRSRAGCRPGFRRG